MKKKTVIIAGFPAMTMMVITLLSFLGSSKGLMAVSLVVLFPLLVLIQGLVSAINRINIGLPLGVSILATIGLMMVLHMGDFRGLMSTTCYYCVVYFMAGMIGYVIGKVVDKVKSYKN